MIIKKFEEQVEAFGHKTAIKTVKQTLTYRQLDTYADRLAAAMVPGDKNEEEEIGRRAALLFEHGADMIIGVIGALKADRVYVPLDVTYPGKRLSYMLENSGADIILTNDKNFSLAEKLAGQMVHPPGIINIERIIAGATGEEVDSRQRQAGRDRPAYILYTSGSTGWPRGVVQTHRNVLYYTRNWIERFSITAADRMTLLTAFSHDGAVQDMFSALLTGACLYPYSVRASSKTDDLYSFLKQEKITIWHSVPSLFRYFAGTLTGKDTLEDLRWVLLGGEPLRPHDLELHKTYFPNALLANIYGQTESSVSAICTINREETFDRLTLGQPPDETRLMLVDKDGDLVEDLGVGEIVVASDYIALGYWQDEAASEKVFIRNEEFGGLYFTGDMGRYTGRSDIKMMGRKDYQVKIRGFRVETGEIESFLLQHKDVREAVVTAKQEENEDTYLCAYLIAGAAVTPGELRNYLSGFLPDYMIPRYFVLLEQMPLTPNGKIDRKSLPDPGMSGAGDTAGVGNRYEPPTNEIERKMVAVWEEVLGAAPIGIHDNFIERGGHSLLVISLVDRIYQVFNVEIKLKDVFEKSTVKELSRLIVDSEEKPLEPINPVEEKEYYPAAPSQKRMYVLNQLEGIGATYHITAVRELEGSLDKQRFEQVIQRLIQRHESLRTSFFMMGQDLVQRVITGGGHGISKVFAGGPGGQFFQKEPPWPPEAVIKDFIRPFDLSQAPLLRVGLLEISDSRHMLIVDMHHIISDALSLEILIGDFMSLYMGEELPVLRLRYRDYAEWQNKKNQAAGNRQQTYWLEQFQGEIPVLELPMDYPRPGIRSFAGDVYYFDLGSEVTGALKRVAAEAGATLYMTILAIFDILLAKLSGQDDIIVGTDEAGRIHADLQPITGLFVNTLALRNFPVPGKSFRTFLKEVKEKTLDAFENRGYQFEELVEHLDIYRDTGRNPVFDVMFSFMKSTGKKVDEIPALHDDALLPGDYENTGRVSPCKSAAKKSNLKVISTPAVNFTSMFDMTLNAQEDDDRLFFSIQYCTELFKPGTIQRYAGYFKTIVTAVTAGVDVEIAAIKIIAGEEKRQILFDFNNTKTPLPEVKNCARLFEARVERGPDTPAAVYRHHTITYKQLNREANRLARVLAEEGITTGVLAALYLKRSITFLTAVIAVYKAGGAYLPIEPDNPPARVEYILRDSEAQVIIIEPSQLEMVDGIRAAVPGLKPVLCPDQGRQPGETFPGDPDQNPGGDTSPGDLAYIIYTSGTTGTPKGVMIHGLGMLNHLYAKINSLSLTAADRIAQTASAGFDISVWQFLAGLLVGGSTCIIDKETVLEPGELMQGLQRLRITILETVPSLLTAFLEAAGRGTRGKLYLRWMILTGESLGVSLVKDWYDRFPGITLMNAYGPTEASDDVTHYVVEEMPAEHPGLTKLPRLSGHQKTIPIGKPVQNLHIYILDAHLSLCPIGVKGEICAAGIGVGLGYWKDAEKTQRSFIPNPYLEEIGDPDFSRMYRTGDRGYFREDGSVEFLGRMDNQVKVRGYRIELGEIEQQLLTHELIKEAAVAALEDENQDKYLCAYIAGTGETAGEKMPGPVELKEFLSGRLPGYMIPSYFVILDHLPLTPNGKIDRKRLPYPQIKPAETYIPPRDEPEQQLAELWAQVLGIEKTVIGIDSNFFQMGGHSIKAAILLSRVQQVFRVQLPLAEVFRHPTLAGMAHRIKELNRWTAGDQTFIPSAEKKEYYELSPAQKRMYVALQVGKETKSYNMPAVVGLIGELKPGIEGLTRIFRQLIRRHESLRTSFRLVAGEPVQVIHEEVKFKIEYYDLTTDYTEKNYKLQITNYKQIPNSKSQTTNQVVPFGGCGAPNLLDPSGEDDSLTLTQNTNTIIKNFIRPFDLAHAPLLRVGLIKEDEQRHILVMDISHIISDGVSYGIVIKDLIDLYNGKDLPPLRLQYNDFSQWQNRWIREGRIKKQKTYWLEQFEKGEIPVLNMPLDNPRPQVRDIEAGDYITFALERGLVQKLHAAARDTGVTPFMILFSVYNILLWRYTRQEEIVVGTLLTGRPHPGLESIIGFFVNTLPLRSRPQPGKTFREFLQEVKETSLKAYENQDYAFDELVKDLGLQGDTSRNPLFDTVFTLDPLDEINALETMGPGLRFETHRSGLKFAKFDLYLEAAVGKETIDILLRYSTQLFKPATIHGIAKYYTEILENLVDNPGMKLKDIAVSHDYIIVETGINPDDSSDFRF